jgi:hypothetical protein
MGVLATLAACSVTTEDVPIEDGEEQLSVPLHCDEQIDEAMRRRRCPACAAVPLRASAPMPCAPSPCTTVSDCYSMVAAVDRSATLTAAHLVLPSWQALRRDYELCSRQYE